jgi:hypothetical protein
MVGSHITHPTEHRVYPAGDVPAGVDVGVVCCARGARARAIEGRQNTGADRRKQTPETRRGSLGQLAQRVCARVRAFLIKYEGEFKNDKSTFGKKIEGGTF